MFNFKGPILFSKSWLNRFLIINHYTPDTDKHPHADQWVATASKDVEHLHRSLKAVEKMNSEISQQSFFVGEGGTTLRFFIFLISKKIGNWKIEGAERLFERPQSEIVKLLSLFGVEVEENKNHFLLKSQGWKPIQRIQVDATVSSQFASGLLLNCWDLENDLELELLKPIISEDYFKMTLQMMIQAGFNCEVEEGRLVLRLKIKKGQKPNTLKMQPEIDMSSAFSLAACAVVNGTAEITNWNPYSTQPDLKFLEIFQKMGIQYKVDHDHIRFELQKKWKSIEIDLNSTPDLFPVLSCLCALAEGRSVLYGAEHLRLKESDRIKKTCELLLHLGIRCTELDDGIQIDGVGSRPDKGYFSLAKEVDFNPDHDHRMAMAAAVMKQAGYKINILNPNVVNKSYPLFWKNVGINP